MTDHNITPELAAALHAFVAAGVPTVHKGNQATIRGKNGEAGYAYRYADLGDVAAAAYPSLAVYGLTFTAHPTRTPQGGYELAGLLLHQGGGYLTGSLPITGRTPQELGSSITYGRRYLLGAMTGIITDEDEDGVIGGQTAPAQDEPYRPPAVSYRRTDDPEALAMTAELVNDLERLAAAQTPPRDLGWITLNWRRERDMPDPADLLRVDPNDLAPLVDTARAHFGETPTT